MNTGPWHLAPCDCDAGRVRVYWAKAGFEAPPALLDLLECEHCVRGQTGYLVDSDGQVRAQVVLSILRHGAAYYVEEP